MLSLYFLDDGSLIIDGHNSIQLIEEVEIARTVGCHYLSGLSGKEAYDKLVKEYRSLDKNGLSCCEESVSTRDKEDK